MKLTATTPIKLGTKDGVQDIAEGQSFDVDKTLAEQLVASGAASAGGAKAADSKPADA